MCRRLAGRNCVPSSLSGGLYEVVFGPGAIVILEPPVEARKYI
jgi:hypothetical protein